MDIPVRFRKASVSDAESIATLCLTVWVDTYCIDGIDPAHANYLLAEYTAENLKQRILEKQVVVAQSNGKILAVIVLDDSSGEIETLYVLPRFKALGIGKQLIEQVRALTDQQLFLTCWEGNEPALGFYKALGFINSGETFFELNGEQIRNIKLVHI